MTRILLVWALAGAVWAQPVARSTQSFDPLSTPWLEQGFGVLTLAEIEGQVVAAAQLSAGSAMASGSVIAVASEAVGYPGSDVALVGSESGVVDFTTSIRPRIGFDAVAKIRWDSEPVGPRRALAGSAFRASAQPDTAWAHGLRIEPGAVVASIISAEGNPGAVILRVSGDMLVRQRGGLWLPVLVDGVRFLLRVEVDNAEKAKRAR